MKKILILLLTFVMSICLFLVVGCDKTITYEGTKVVFELEGGSFQNATKPVVHYYQFAEGGQRLIKELGSFESTGSGISRPGYNLVGWFTTKNTDSSGNVTYENQWDFTKDEVGEDGVTLYACWQVNAKYTYAVFDIEEYDKDEPEFVIRKEVGAGSSFNERYATRPGFTLIALFDENKQPWDWSFKHPGGDTDCEIKVYAQYIEGTYTVVRTASELKLASTRNENIYLDADIDMEGEVLSFDNFTKQFLGNGHTVSNFLLLDPDPFKKLGKEDVIQDFSEPNSKCFAVSLFGNTKDATIKDVNFEGVEINLDTTYSVDKIYVAPISVNATGKTVISNVTFKGTVTIVELPDTIEADRPNRLIVELTNAVCFKDASTTITDFVSEITLIEN